MQPEFSTQNWYSLREFNSFLYDIRYILLFYVLGDFITTVQALSIGVEENGFLALVIAEFGVWAFFVLKLAFVLVVYWFYKDLMSSSDSKVSEMWPMVKGVITFVGVFLVVNNLMVIWGNFGILQLLGIGSL
ncbi:hypothetical protein SAMN04488587_1733 [Methanococcoides vulcani]|uniref:DUF5658 domain-containing protein n=1 Tax=Methanococcoides vulcani TaxID=1353158 RepID=A0A1I0AP45_9EURY|nr:hypothetical protein [Methanococcoides vulcani]SES96136.1 hypothetical protein SAMN04488587_1733 [Methanococcoides vulcani]